jgi:hypothetical protein
MKIQNLKIAALLAFSVLMLSACGGGGGGSDSPAGTGNPGADSEKPVVNLSYKKFGSSPL